MKLYTPVCLGLLTLQTALAQTLKTLTVVLSICSTPASLSVNESTSVMATVNTMFKTCSKDKAHVEPVVVPFIVQLPCTPTSRSCDVSSWADYADSMMRQQNIQVDTFPYRIYVLPDNVGCTWGGLGYIGPSCVPNCRVWIAGSVARRPAVYVHELGHNLGLNHATYGGNEYGDASSAMGACCFLGCYNSAQTDFLHWTSPKHTVIAPIQRPESFNLKANEYVKIFDSSSSSTWFVQYRTPDFAFDNVNAAFVNKINVYSLTVGSSQSVLQRILNLKESVQTSLFSVQYLQNTNITNATHATVVFSPATFF
jgi:hypothetical protein